MWILIRFRIQGLITKNRKTLQLEKIDIFFIKKCNQKVKSYPVESGAGIETGRTERTSKKVFISFQQRWTDTVPGLEKTRVFLKKPSPVGFFGFFWFFLGFLGFFGFFWVFFTQTRGFLGFFSVSRILLSVSRL
jgi:hypothetical protein